MNKEIEMESATFCEISTEELNLIKTAISVAMFLLSEDHKDQKPLQALYEKLKRM